MGIDRPDWNYANDKGHTDPLPDSSVPVPVDERDIAPWLRDAAGAVSYEQPDYAPVEVDPVAGMSPEQLTLAGTAAQMILETCPVDEEWFAEQFDTLSAGTQKAIYSTLAAFPHLRGEDLVVAIEDRLTLAETVEMKKWASYLPDVVRQWLLRG